MARPDIDKSTFSKFAEKIAFLAGEPLAFILAFLVVLVWGLSGPIFGFGDTWQLVINTSTTIVTFLMVFLIQNTQNRDIVAVQIKLDELIRAIEGTDHTLLDLEELDENELKDIQKKYEALASKARDKCAENL